MNKFKSPSATPDEAQLDIGWLRKAAVNGAIWLSLLAAAAIPLGYVRTWMLGQLGSNGEVLGTFAAFLIFTQLVFALVVPGGSSVLTSIVPRMADLQAKSSLVASYALLSGGATACFAGSLYFLPSLSSRLLQGTPLPLDFTWLLTLAPILVASQVVLFALQGMMQFKLVAVLGQVQIALVSTIAALGLVFFPETFQENASFILFGTIAIAHMVIVGVGLIPLVRDLPAPDTYFRFPPRFWRFTAFVHLNTLCTFAYTNIDQIFVGTWLGPEELGAYFALLQCALLINFLPQKVGQLLLSSFSHLAANGGDMELSRAYQKICRLTLIMATPLTLLFVLFSYQISGFFGQWLADRHIYLVFISASLYVGILGSISSMLVLSKQSSILFFANSAAVVSIQFIVTWGTIGEYGVFGAIAGKASAILIGQVGLFSIIRWHLPGIKITPPNSYWIGLGVVCLGVVLACTFEPHDFFSRLSALIILTAAYMLMIGFRAREISSIARGIRQSKDIKASNY